MTVFRSKVLKVHLNFVKMTGRNASGHFALAGHNAPIPVQTYLVEHHHPVLLFPSGDHWISANESHDALLDR